MLETFYKCSHALIYSQRRNGRKRGDLVCRFKRGEADYLTIFKNAPNNYTIEFDSHIEGNSWWHYDLLLREVVCAIKSFDGGTDMFGNPFHNIKEGTFEY